jgi:hypothetical protein
MDPDASLQALAAASPATVAPTASPKILQLSSLTGSFYKTDHLNCSPLPDIARGGFVALLAFAIEYRHPIGVQDCPVLAAFQAAYSLANLMEVSVALIQQGLHILLASKLLASKTLQATPFPAAPRNKLPSSCSLLSSSLLMGASGVSGGLILH